jgi:hypothetical protein
MRCIILRRFLLALFLLVLGVLPVCAQTGLPVASGTDSAAHALHRTDTTRADTTGFVHWTYKAIQSLYKFLRPVTDPIIHFFERLWQKVTKDTSERDSILRFPLGRRKAS